MALPPKLSPPKLPITMGGSFDSYSFPLPKPALHLLLLLASISRAVSLLNVFLRLRPRPPPPPSQARRSRSPHSPDGLLLSESPSPRLIKSLLPAVSFGRLAGDSPSTACVVCLSAFEARDQVRELGNCRHGFHVECIDRWIDADGITCPLCRSQLLPSPPEEEKGALAGFRARIRSISLSAPSFISNLYADNYL